MRKKWKFRAFFDPRLLRTTHDFLPMTHDFLPTTHDQNSNSRALIDSGAGSCYASAQLISALVIKPSEIKDQQIDMLLTSRKAKVEQYDVTITSYDGRYEIMTRLNKPLSTPQRGTYGRQRHEKSTTHSRHPRKRWIYPYKDSNETSYRGRRRTSGGEDQVGMDDPQSWGRVR